MRQLCKAVAAWSAADLRIAGATLVRFEGSTPHQLGLTLVTNEAGDTAGALSGGCVDADIVLACDRVLAGGPAEVLTFGADFVEFEVGLLCGGTITVWVHELDRDSASAIAGPDDAAVLIRLVGDRIEQCAVTLPQARGVACGNVEEESSRVVAARWLLGERVRTEFQETPDGGQVFLEAFGDRRLFVVVGSSGYSEALCAQAALLGYETVVVEPRPRFAAGITYADEVLGSWPDVAIRKLAEHGRLDSTSAIVVCTHDPKFDEPALAAALATPAAFIGALGSRSTSAERFARLRARGMPDSELRRIQAPVGLDLGGATPAEMAVSVAAQIIATARGRSAAPLRDTAGPVHVR